MSTYIRSVLEEKFPLTITPALVNAVIKYTTSFEVANSAALSTPYLGLVPCKFKEQFKNEFFDLFNVNSTAISKLFNTHGTNYFAGVKLAELNPLSRLANTEDQEKYEQQGVSSTTIKKAISIIPSINTNFKVVSDPFNLFCNYAAYKILTSKITDKLKIEGAAAVLKLLQYKYFTSLVNFRFRFRPSESVMRATFEQLSDRFDIRKYGSWKNVMDARVNDLLSPDSVHAKTLNTFEDDKAVLYLISDFQTRIRNQINIFVMEYMRVKETNDVIGDYSATGTDSETGEKVLLDQQDAFTTAILKVYSDSLSTSRWLFDPAIKITVSLFSAITTSTFRKFLIAYSEYAVLKNKQGLKDEVKDVNGSVLYIGPQVFIDQVIQKSFRYCVTNNVNIDRPVEVLKTVKAVMSSSRVADEGILSVRSSSSYITSEIADTNREATVSALRIGLIVYIVLLALKEMK